jgi:RNA polymerase sigma-70 factor (ECF subfamily)
MGSPGDWRMIATTANGQPAAAAYHRNSDGVHRAFGLGVLTVTSTGIARIVVFGGSDLVARFGLSRVHPDAGA